MSSVAWSCLSLAHQASAQQASEHLGTVRVEGTPANGRKLDDSIAGRLDAPYRTAGSSAEIEGATIERFRGISSADILKGVAGVTASDPRTANAIDVNIRGIQGQSRVPVIIDGGQSTMDAYRGYAGQSQRNYLDPDLISSITINKGPSLQANAPGGDRRCGDDADAEGRRCPARRERPRDTPALRGVSCQCPQPAWL